jgi:hypothetical protein
MGDALQQLLLVCGQQACGSKMQDNQPSFLLKWSSTHSKAG